MTQFSPQYFERMDEEDDRAFYQQARKVVHIDDGAIAAVGRLFRELVPPDSSVLDLMSSWRSHWPAGHPKARLVGLGLNREEMEDNPDLDEIVVHDVNRDLELPFDDDTFDAVAITVSVQYLTHPVDTFGEVNRILNPGGMFIVSFSNRMFPTKAVYIWRASSDRGRVDLVGSYMEAAGNFEDIQGVLANSQDSPPGDPLFAVHSRKVISGSSTPTFRPAPQQA
jgi:SAM-dependent methyltransferase